MFLHLGLADKIFYPPHTYFLHASHNFDLRDIKKITLFFANLSNECIGPQQSHQPSTLLLERSNQLVDCVGGVVKAEGSQGSRLLVLLMGASFAFAIAKSVAPYIT
jgi:hypothetical protein